MDPQADITALIEAGNRGDAEATAALYSIVYGELKRIARSQRRRLAGDQTLGTTALVHEAYERLAVPGALAVDSRAHFLSLCARAMRQILIDRARQRGAQKRGGGGVALELRDADGSGDDDPAALVALDQRLHAMEALDPRLVRLVELRSFAGLSLDEIAPLLGITLRTAQRDWLRARAWLADSSD
jgi:RNA polymerase sigma factor (TIGR02999 family)